MNLEFVVINADGKEVGWVDPVEKVWETKCYWYVANGTKSLLSDKPYVYRFWKYPRWEYITRPIGGTD